MKKRLLFVILALLIVLTSCSKAEETTEQETATPSATPVAKEEEKVEETDSRVIAVMIDNDNSDARPHAGIEDAFLIYEAYVEGGATRMMALFKDVQTEKIGPVRSSRHYFLDYALENDAIYVHYGWSPKAQADIPALGVNNINGVLDGGVVFWRDNTYTRGYHNAFTSIEKITNFAKKTKDYRDTSEVSNFKKNTKDKDIEGDSVNKIVLPYAGFYNVSYEYDKTENYYKRYINKNAHTTQKNNHISPTNIIIQKAVNYTISGDASGRQELNTVGTGEGFFITGGNVAKITWSKPDRKSKTTYKFENGEEISLNPGQTWIQIVPPSMKITME